MPRTSLQKPVVVSRSIFGRTILLGVGLLWAGGIFFGARAMLNYETAEASPGTPSPTWPTKTTIQRTRGKFTLAMFAHPDCPCTRASLTELEEIGTKLRGSLNSIVVFSKPGAEEAEARGSWLWRNASSLPGVTVRWDSHAVETERFGARVSGQALLYDPDGRLVFSGGLTSARGHVGDNRGVDAIFRRVGGDASAPAQFPVFGCSLHDPDAGALAGDPSWKK
jgi:hypothetical protein